MKTKHFASLALAASLFLAAPSSAQPAGAFSAQVEASIAQVLPRMIAWRRDFHEHPELSYEEVRTARVVAAHLRSLRLEVRTGVAQTGVVGVLRGGRPGPVIALRADMDALPVTEEGDLPFRSRARGVYQRPASRHHARLRTRHPRRGADGGRDRAGGAARGHRGHGDLCVPAVGRGRASGRAGRRAAHAGGKCVRRSPARSDLWSARLAGDQRHGDDDVGLR